MTWIGIDVAKRSFTASSPTDCDTFTMDLNGWQAFLSFLPSGTLTVCMESSGPYWLQLAEWLQQADIPYALANPRNVRRFAQASEHRSKTDAIDAELLRRFAEAFQPQTLPALEGVYRQLRSFSRRILQLQRQLDQERDRLEKASADPHCPQAVLSSHELLANELSRLIEEFEHQARTLILRHPELGQSWRLLRSIPGIGDKTARTLLAEYGPSITTASPKQMTRFAGLDVVLFESGSSVRKRPRISKQGNWRVRRALYLAALTAIRHNPTLKNFYQRKCQQGLEKKQALIAVMRKLLHQTHGVLKHQTPYQTNIA